MPDLRLSQDNSSTILHITAWPRHRGQQRLCPPCSSLYPQYLGVLNDYGWQINQPANHLGEMNKPTKRKQDPVPERTKQSTQVDRQTHTVNKQGKIGL